MRDVIPVDAIPPGVLTTAEIDAAMAYAEAEKAPATRAAYASDWRDFAAWCAARSASPLPAHVGIVAAYLSWVAESSRKASIIGRRAAAIAHRHKLAGHEPPTSAEAVRAVLRGIRRTIGAASKRKQAATADVLTTMLACVPAGTLQGKRDKALLSLGLGGASVFKMMEVSRHKSVDVLRGYVRRADLFREHAGAAFL
jgi:site-specific recombinase XerD